MAKHRFGYDFSKAMIEVNAENEIIVIESDKEGELAYNLTEIVRGLENVPNLSIKISYDNTIDPVY